MERDAQQLYLVYDFRNKDFRPMVNLKRLKMGKMRFYLKLDNFLGVLVIAVFIIILYYQ